MDNGRLFRAVLTVVVLLLSIWALRHIQAQRATHRVSPADRPPAEEKAQVIEEASAAPAIVVETVPLVALDNTCFYSSMQDLSRCTGALSFAPAREYRIAAIRNQVLYFGAKPRSDIFDISVALLTADAKCIVGYDENGPGWPEAAVVTGLDSGEYVLVVGGYGEDCGPYELTVSMETPEMARVVETGVLNGRNGTVVRWGTFAEVDMAHYALYRWKAEERERVAVLRAHGSPAGFARYRVIDRRPQPDSTYEIEAVARDGRRELFEVTT
jgi:hypothetical protein